MELGELLNTSKLFHASWATPAALSALRQEKVCLWARPSLSRPFTPPLIAARKGRGELPPLQGPTMGLAWEGERERKWENLAGSVD